MKKILSGIIFLLSLTTFSQTNDYNKLWNNIDSLEVAGKVATANEQTVSLMKKSLKAKNFEHYIKSKIYHYRLYQINHENSNQYILNDINMAIGKLSAPFKNILLSYKAEMLMDYFKSNRSQLRKRSQIDNPDNKDLETWSLKTLQDSIKNTYEASITNENILIETSNTEISELLSQNPVNRKYQPSLYDLLSRRLLDFYSNSSFFTSEFGDLQFGFPKEQLFLPGAEFYNRPIKPEKSSTFRALNHYQKLESLHAKKKETAPLIFWTLERLKFARNELNNDAANKNFIAALEQLSKENKGHKIQAMIDFTLAYHYYEQSWETNIENPDCLTKSFELLERITSKYVNTASAQNAIRLKAKIAAPDLHSKIQGFLASGEPGRVFVSYKNIDTLYYKVFQASRKFLKGVSYKDRDAYVKKKAENFKDSATVALPGPKDFITHSTEIAFNGQSPGQYLVYLSTGKGNFSYGLFQISDLAISSTKFNKNKIFRVVDRKTGESLSGVQMQLKRDDKILQTKESDKNGEFSLNNRFYRRNKESILFINGEDTLVSNYNRYSYLPHNSKTNSIRAKTLFFLDRAIYRPGQKVYFKGVLLKNENDFTAVVSNEFVEVQVNDPNRKKVQEFKMKTNEYGSFTGSFILPDGGVTGEFSIYTKENMDAETAFWNKISGTGNFYHSAKKFSVEEYKRPTFKVAFDTIKKSFKLRDSVKLTGSAKSYMGAAIAKAKLKYEVKREQLVHSWWRRHYSSPVIIKTDSVTTDENGDFELWFFSEAKKDDLENPDLIYKYTVEASVTDITGETRTESKELKIGNKNLIVDLDAQDIITPGETLKISVKTTNLNGNKVLASGKLRIFKLKAPDKILKERWWEVPEFNLMSEAVFHKLFPNEPYENEISPKGWPKAEMIHQTDFKVEGKFEDEIEIQKDWKAGNYLIELEVKSQENEASAKKIFQLDNPKRKYLADNQRISFDILNRKQIKLDGCTKLKIQTAYKDLNLKISATSSKGKTFFKQFLKLDGSRIIKIPVEKLEKPEFKLMITGVRDNSVIHREERVSFKEEEKPLQLSTKTFRNKIEPGIDETWSFSISDSENKVNDAEILASMYDASLDQFRTDKWETNSHLENRNNDYPLFQFYNIGNVNQLSDNFPYVSPYHVITLFFDSLELFGFQYGTQNSWSYRSYLKKRKEEKNQKLEGNIKGRIVGEDGKPIPGVNVVIKNTATGTLTNYDGVFAIDAEKGDVLQISYLGFKSTDYLITEQTEIFLMLEQDSSQLDETVVVGNAAQVQEEVVGSVEEKEEYMPLFSGNVDGIEVTEMGATKRISIRGNSNINGTPLFIVDGKPVEEYNLDSKDILDVQILDDTKAVALYGARGKNGVIIISTKQGMANLQQVETRKNLDETAFFYPNLKLDENGEIEFSFTTPEALTSWKLRLLAHTKSWNTGKLQKTVVMQKDLNVIPNPPRFLREGDSLVFKAKISNLSEETITGNAVLKLFNAVTMQPIDTIMNNADNLQTFSMNSSNSQVVTWKLVVPDTVPAVIYSIVAKAGDFSDGVENLLPVLKNRMLVKESIPFFVRAEETENYVFENLKNQDSESLQNHQFTLEYSSNPAWYAIQSLPYLMEQEHESSEQVFSRIFANSVGNKIVSSQPKIARVFKQWQQDSTLESNLNRNENLKSILLAETPWVMDAESETAKKKRIGSLFNSEKIKRETQENLTKLSQMQNPSGAFPWFPGGKDNFYITRHIVKGFGHLEKLGVAVDAREILKKAIQFVDTEFLEREKDRRDDEQFYKSNFALYYLYARSFHLENFPLPEAQNKIAEKIIKLQQEDWLQQSLHNKGVLALLLHTFDKNETAKQILNSLKETAVYSEDYGMYWKENEPSWYFSRTPVETQAMLIDAFSEVLNDEKSIEEMKIWLLQNKRTNHWASTKATTAAGYALLMQGQDWLSISNNTTIKVGNEEIQTEKLAETKKEAGSGYIKINWNAEEVNENLGDIQIKNNNSTAGYGGAYWQYFEDLDKIKDHSESPLNIEKELYLNKPNNKLKKITKNTPIKTGDLVTVRLIVRATAAIDFIHLKDMSASGFEPTNVLSKYKYQDGTAYYQSTRDAATHFFFDSIRKGTYVLEYTLRANNPGDFSNGITLIESMYAPEFSSHTKGIRVQIRD